MAAILSDDPTPLRSRVPTAPAALERIINTALEKDPDERWQTAGDVARQLRWLIARVMTCPMASSLVGNLESSMTPALPLKTMPSR